MPGQVGPGCHLKKISTLLSDLHWRSCLKPRWQTADILIMVFSGSQNASRVPGVYAYPMYNYSSQPVSPVEKIAGNHFAGKQIDGVLAARSTRNIFFSSAELNELAPRNSYEQRLFESRVHKGFRFDMSA